MPGLKLTPTLDTLRQEYVLVQAWKKAHDYVRAHNWYADVLELDLSNTRLRATIDELRNELNASELTPDPVRLVFAPKSTNWEIGKGYWQPKARERQNLRPLAHLSIRDQTIATAFMLCMADKVETLQGNPKWSLQKCRDKGMMSYGHRLMVDEIDGELRYRWANANYYRGYFEDYQNFIRRPDDIISSDFPKAANWAVVQADFSQFYDRVRPENLHNKIETLFADSAESAFLQAFKAFFKWGWHADDRKDALGYARRTKTKTIKGFDRLALPQGMAASGFFSNVFLLDFDKAIWAHRGRPQNSGWRVIDYCRYVDDLRLVLELPHRPKMRAEMLRKEITEWLQSVAGQNAPGMILNPKKTSILLGQNKASRTVMFSDAMKTIQGRVSGAIDLDEGEETLTMIEGLFASEPEETPLSTEVTADADPFFAIFQDVKDETVARFSANRFRKAFRLVRQLAPEVAKKESKSSKLTKEAMDQRAAHFSRRLVWRWVKDPSNVRLLRIALDLNPDPEVAKRIIGLVHPIVINGTRKGWVRKVAEYCTAELFKASATEMGMQAPDDQLPSGANPFEVQKLMADYAQEVFAARARLPWYLVQQSLLLLAAAKRPVVSVARANSPAEWRDYLIVHQFLRGVFNGVSGAEVVHYSLAASCFDRQPDESLKRFNGWLSNVSHQSIADTALRVLLEEDLCAAQRVHLLLNASQKQQWGGIFASYGIAASNRFPKDRSTLEDQRKKFALAEVAASPANPFQQEYLALCLLKRLIEEESQIEGVITTWHLSVEANWRTLYPNHPEFLNADFIVNSNIVSNVPVPYYEVPQWLGQSEQWRYRVGQILRSVVVGNLDFTINSSRMGKRPCGYRPYTSHWYRRRYGLFNGRSALGPDWLPVSTWFCSLLTRLLAWPGFPLADDETGLEPTLVREQVIQRVQQQIDKLKQEFGRSSSTCILRQNIRLRSFKGSARSRRSVPMPFRVAVLQTVLPRFATLASDPELCNANSRYDQLRHFTSALCALNSMLRLRETHSPQDGQLDLLVLPELSIYGDDVARFLVPFARQRRCIIFGGLIYRPLITHPRRPLVNTGIWLLPNESYGGLRVERIEQGKGHLAPNTEDHIPGLEPWRPCQHIIQLVDDPLAEPVWRFSGSICYDATDLALASDLRNLTDTWLIPALNRDVNLFDSMVAALHYHMFQHVVVCNNGEFGGSVTQAPFSENFRRTILHHHGNEQATVSFFELDLDFYRRPRPHISAPALPVMLKPRPAGLIR